MSAPQKFLEESPSMASYIDDTGYTKTTKATDSSRWGKGATFYDDRVSDYGSYLDTAEKLQQVNRNTKMNDSTRWGSVKERYDDKVDEYNMSYLHKMQAHEQERMKREKEIKEQTIKALKEKQGGVLDPETNIFPYAELKDKFPKGVDPTCKELYLSDEEFVQVFGMDFDSFEQLSAFKKKQLKKKAGLF